MTYRPQIAAEVRAEMALKKVNVTQLASAADISRSRLHSRLSGSKPFDTDELTVVAAVLNVSVADLISRAESRAAA